MIDIKPPEEEKMLKIEFTDEQKKAFEEFQRRQNKLLLKAEPSVGSSISTEVSKELHELNKTLKEILREMRKRKT